MGERDGERRNGEEGSTFLVSSEQMSFKMHFRCPRALKLRAAVSQKLVELLGNYVDDVLTEYVVVLVCNGKNQNQARDALEAFLGDNTNDFIAWLWHLLSEQPSTSLVVKGENIICNSCDTEKEYKNERRTNLQQKDSHYGLSSPSFSTNSLSLPTNLSEDLQKHDVSASLTGLAIQRTSDGACYHPNESIRINSVHARSSSEISDGLEVGTQFELHKDGLTLLSWINSWLCNFLTSCSAAIAQKTRSKHHDHSDKCLPVSRILQSFNAEDPGSISPSLDVETFARNLSSQSLDNVPHKSNHSRGSVWDRLGKPCVNNEGFISSEDSYRHEQKVVRPFGKSFNQHRLVQTLSDRMPISRVIVKDSFDRCRCKFVSNGHDDECHVMRQINRVTALSNDQNTLKRKRGFGCFVHGHYSSFSCQGEFDFQQEGTSQKLLSPSPENGSGYPDTKSTNLQLKKVARLSPEICALTQTMVKPDILHSTDEITNCGSREREILDVKLKLQKVEVEMLKLRSKHAEMGKDVKPLTESAPRNKMLRGAAMTTQTAYSQSHNRPTFQGHYTRFNLRWRRDQLEDIDTSAVA